MDPGSFSGRTQRNVTEKRRRMEMKHLLDRLVPLIHLQPSKLSVPEVVDEATNYVKKLKNRVEKLKRKQKPKSKNVKKIMPVLSITTSSDNFIVEVNLVCGKVRNFMSQEIIEVLQEEGGEVFSYCYHTVGDTVFYTVKSKAMNVRIGMEISRIHDKLKELIY